MRSPHRHRSLLPLPLPLLAPFLALVLAGCAGDPGSRLPEGWALAGRSDRIVPVLERLEGMERTPIAEQAAVLRSRIAGCELFLARCPIDPEPAQGGDEDREPACRLAAVAECVDELPAWVAEAGSEAEPPGWALSRRGDDGPWLVVRALPEAADGSLVLAAEAGPVGLDDAISLLLPSAEPPGPARLADGPALVHLRVRPDGGLDLARFVEGESWGARMYRLRSDLFEGKALAGVWELAVYAPGESDLIAPMALAVDVEEGESDLAAEAMERFLGELGEVWPVRRGDYALGGHAGACLGNVRVMPDLAPCYVTTPEALVVGWNPRSLELALGGGESGGIGAETSGARAYVSRFPAADRVIAANTGAPSPIAPSFYPWGRIDLSGRRDGDAYRFRLRLGPRRGLRSPSGEAP